MLKELLTGAGKAVGSAAVGAVRVGLGAYLGHPIQGKGNIGHKKDDEKLLKELGELQKPLNEQKQNLSGRIHRYDGELRRLSAVGNDTDRFLSTNFRFFVSNRDQPLDRQVVQRGFEAVKSDLLTARREVNTLKRDVSQIQDKFLRHFSQYDNKLTILMRNVDADRRRRDQLLDHLKETNGGNKTDLELASLVQELNKRFEAQDKALKDLHDKQEKQGSGGINPLDAAAAAAGAGALSKLGKVGKALGRNLVKFGRFALTPKGAVVGAGVLAGLAVYKSIGYHQKRAEARAKGLPDPVAEDRKNLSKEMTEQYEKDGITGWGKSASKNSHKDLHPGNAGRFANPLLAPTTLPKPKSDPSVVAMEQKDNYRQKADFLQHGKLPGGFEFLPGHMGRLGSPGAVAATGATPLAGAGVAGNASPMGQGSPQVGVSPEPVAPPPAPSAAIPGPPMRLGGPVQNGNEAQVGAPQQNQGPSGRVAGSNDVAHQNPRKAGAIDRSAFNSELQNPEVRRRFLTMMQAEVGSQGKQAQLGFAETVFNRAHAEGKTLAQILQNNPHRQYYEPYKNGGFDRAGTALAKNPDKLKALDSVLEEARAGSDLTSGATHNASAGVAASVRRGGYDAVAKSVKEVGGETYYSKTWEQKKIAQLPRVKEDEKTAEQQQPRTFEEVGREKRSRWENAARAGDKPEPKREQPQVQGADRISNDLRNSPRREVAETPGFLKGADGRSPFNYALTPQAMKEFGLRDQSRGEVERNLVTIRTNSGKTVKVNANVADDAKNFLNELEKRGYKINDLGGYSYRANVNNPSRLSTHAMGGTLDINPGRNPNKSVNTDMPEDVKKLAMLHGFAQLGDDKMHFERVSPENRALYLKRLLAEEKIGKDHPQVAKLMSEGLIKKEDVASYKEFGVQQTKVASSDQAQATTTAANDNVVKVAPGKLSAWNFAEHEAKGKEVVVEKPAEKNVTPDQKPSPNAGRFAQPEIAPPVGKFAQPEIAPPVGRFAQPEIAPREEKKEDAPKAEPTMPAPSPAQQTPQEAPSNLGGGNQPESEAPSPGSGGMGSFGRCFV